MSEIILQIFNDIYIVYFRDLNGLLYFAFHLLIIGLLWLSLYYRYMRGPLHQWFQRFKFVSKKKTLDAYDKYSSRLKSEIARLKRRLSKDKSPQNITLSISSTTHAHSIGGIARISVKRGENSWAHFSLAWTVISVLAIEFNSIYSSMNPSSMSLGILILDLSAITYLCFFSGWFRNKVAQVVSFRNNTYE